MRDRPPADRAQRLRQEASRTGADDAASTSADAGARAGPRRDVSFTSAGTAKQAGPAPRPSQPRTRALTCRAGYRPVGGQGRTGSRLRRQRDPPPAPSFRTPRPGREELAQGGAHGRSGPHGPRQLDRRALSTGPRSRRGSRAPSRTAVRRDELVEARSASTGFSQPSDLRLRPRADADPVHARPGARRARTRSAATDTAGTTAQPARADRAGMSPVRFDPYATLRALEQERVAYVIIGGLARVL